VEGEAEEEAIAAAVTRLMAGLRTLLVVTLKIEVNEAGDAAEDVGVEVEEEAEAEVVITKGTKVTNQMVGLVQVVLIMPQEAALIM